MQRLTRQALLNRVRQNDPARATAAERRRARGIGFGVELVRAIRAGVKTQTRRLVRPQPVDAPDPAACPTARLGEVLYVREPFLSTETGYAYAIDEPAGSVRKFKAGMYMPRCAARLWLRVTVLRVERLQTITPTDLAAEGLPAGRTLAEVWDAFYPDAGHRFADNPWVWVVEFASEN
ncbi:MAG: hypothetical protein QM754_04535 [Tepidisphaeraceae bacterium]